MKTLYPQQKESLDTLITALGNHGAALDSSETGTGKTLKSVEVARLASNKALIVCPKAVIPAWEEAFQEQGVPFLGAINYEMLRTGKTEWGTWGVKHGLPEFIYPNNVDFIIWDEVHKTMGTKTPTGKMLACAKERCNLMLSATAAEDPTELKNIGYVLGLYPELWQFMQWAKEKGCYQDHFNNLKFRVSERDCVLRELNLEIYPERGHKVTREELSEFFQETHIVTEPIDFGDAGQIEKIHTQMAEELGVIAAARAGDSDFMETADLTASMRDRQEAEILKIPVLAEMVKDYRSGGFSVAVFLNFDASIKALCKLVPGLTPKIWGKQDGEERKDAIAQFQCNEARVIVCNVAAGGVGISLHDLHGGHPRVALISPTWNAKDTVQVTGRVDRAGGKTPTLQRILFSKGTIEDAIRNSVNEKLKNMTALHRKDLTW